MRIDLHTHSTASDGTSTPAELVRAAARAGLDVVALTDHELAGAGLFGLEADHPDHNSAERDQMRRLAEDLGPAVTGSSDFHGANKTVRLGENTTAPEVCERIAAAGRTAPITAS